MEHLSVGVVATSRKPDEARLAIHPAHVERIGADLRRQRNHWTPDGKFVSLAQGMGKKTIAEGVETEAAFAVVRELGVDSAQGYLFGRPAPADEVLCCPAQTGA